MGPSGNNRLATLPQKLAGLLTTHSYLSGSSQIRSVKPILESVLILMATDKEEVMGDLVRFGVSAEEELMLNFDRLSSDNGYGNRSEALRDLMRDALVQARLEKSTDTADVLGSLTLVYDHHARELVERMSEIQHARHELVVSVLHVHISHDDCMELIALRGRAGEVRDLANALLSLKGVKHGKLFLTLPAREIVARKKAVHKHFRHKTPPARRIK